MKHIVNFSGGLCSFWAAHRVVQKYGPEDVVLLFADTLIEDPDLYAFNNAASAILGIPITRVADGRKPWELFLAHGMIGNSRFPICSIYLKRHLLDEWYATHGLNLRQQMEGCLPGMEDHRPPATIYIGFDWTEEKRLNDIRAEKPQWRWEAPMQWEPIWDKCRMEREATALGLKIPRLYGLGFPHNNCGGRCVRAGISHWVHLYRVLPDRFIEWEQEEQDTAEALRQRGITPLSILKDRRGGTTKNLYLADLRVRIEAGEKFGNEDWGGCGCGGAATPEGK